MTAEPDDALRPPSDAFLRHRWLAGRRVEYVQAANKILLEHGAVHGSTVYPSRHRARWRAESLIRLMVELRLHERWELQQHVERKQDGWVWAVEYRGRGERQ